MNENLTNSSHQLAFNCNKLKREKLISKKCSSNGIIYIVQIHGNKPIKVFHQSKLDELFPILTSTALVKLMNLRELYSNFL